MTTRTARIRSQVTAAWQWIARDADGWTTIALLAGLILRISLVRFARWNDDELGMYNVALDIARGDRQIAFGPPITDTDAMLPGPAVHYFHALALVVGRGHPYSIGVVVGVLHVAAIAVLTRAVRATISVRSSIYFACLLSVSPWDVLFSDRPYNPNLCLAWFMLMLGSFVLGQVKANGKLLALAAFLAVILPQSHMSAIVALPALVVLAWIGRRPALAGEPPKPLKWRWLAGGAIAGCLTYLPALVSELGTDFANSKLSRSQGLGGARDSFEWLRSAVSPLLFSSSEIGWNFLRGYWEPAVDPALYLFKAEAWPTLWRYNGAWLVMILTTLLISCLAHASWVRRICQSRAKMLLTDRWTACYVVVVAGCALLLLAGNKIYFPHYNIVSLPLAFIVVARELDRLAERPRHGPWLAGAWVGFFGLTSIPETGRYYGMVDGLIGLGRQTQIVEMLCERQQGRPFAVEFDYLNQIDVFRMLAGRTDCRWAEVPPDGAAVKYHVFPAFHAPPAIPDGSELRMFKYPPLRVWLVAPKSDPSLRN